ncbi:Hypothetical protein NTJ_09683 [Nesidiocoris tenuis]|uniref:Uncharacterized protein n=1 Tax=Nesidiocoris tenuis TaxID=355587 RepID=A0ABN7B0Y9_9HEMI|nr:Hypothetical protein NTJ_09683 [Nesidiocoris tenuis]
MESRICVADSDDQGLGLRMSTGMPSIWGILALTMTGERSTSGSHLSPLDSAVEEDTGSISDGYLADAKHPPNL